MAQDYDAIKVQYYATVPEDSASANLVLSAAELLALVNEAYEDFNQAQNATLGYYNDQRPPAMTRALESINIASGTQKHTPTAEWWLLTSITILLSDNTYRELVFMEDDARAQWYTQKGWDNTATGDPEAFTIQDGDIYLYPIPNYTKTAGIIARYTAQPSAGVVATAVVAMTAGASLPSVVDVIFKTKLHYLAVSTFYGRIGNEVLEAKYEKKHNDWLVKATILGIKKGMVAPNRVLVDPKRPVMDANRDKTPHI